MIKFYLFADLLFPDSMLSRRNIFPFEPAFEISHPLTTNNNISINIGMQLKNETAVVISEYFPDAIDVDED